MKPSISVCLLACLFLAFTGCNRPVPNKALMAATKTGEQYNDVFKELNKRDILKKLFDDPQFDGEGMALWKPNFYESRAFPISYDQKCHTSIDTILHFIDQGKRECAIALLVTYNYKKAYDDSTKIEISDCHFCGAQIGIALFAQTKDNQWELYKFEKSFTTLGYFGTYKTGRADSGTISLKEIGDHWTCLSLINGVGGNMGEFWSTETLYSIEQYNLGGFPNQVLSEILSYSPHHEEELQGKVTKTNTLVRVNKKAKSYFDLDLLIDKDGKQKTEHLKYSEEHNSYIEK